MSANDGEGKPGLFDSGAIRSCSILPDCDADEAYCVRHDRAMSRLNLTLHHDGALFTTSDGWGVYSCPDCMTELGSDARPMLKRELSRAFDVFDDPDVEQLTGAFRYVGEAGAGGVEQ
jgi:hypothetical protein